MQKPKKRGIKFSSSSVTFDVSNVDGLLFEAKVPQYRKDALRKTWRVLIVVDKPLRFDGDVEVAEGSEVKDDDTDEQVMEHDSAVTLSQLVGHTIRSMNKESTLLAPRVQVLCAAIPNGPEWERWDVRGRLIALFDSIQPDVVMLAGTQIAYAVAQPPPKRLLAAEYGRLKDYSIDSFTRGKGRKRRSMRAIVTMPLEQLVDPDPPIRGADGGGAVNLISDFCDHLEAALADRNRYEMAKWVEPRRKLLKRVDTMPKFKAFMKALKACDKPSIDTESDSLGRKVNTLLCMQFFLPTADGKGGVGYFLPMQHKESTWTGKEYARIRTTLRKYFEEGGSDYLVMHNGKHDIIQFYNGLGVRWFGHRLYDTIAGAQVLNENRKHLPKSVISRPYGLDTLEMNYGYIRTGLAVEKEDRSNMADRPLSELEPYGVLDAITTYCIHRIQRNEAKRVRHAGFIPLVVEQVGRTMRSISRMEYQGLRMDVAYLAKMAMSDSPVNRAVEEYTELFRTSKAARKVNLRLAKKAGWQPSGLYGDVKVPWVFNVRKTEHIAALFLKELGLAPVAYSKKTGEPSLGKAFLSEYKASVPEAEWLSDYSEMFKLKTGFIDTLLRRLLTDPDAIADQHIRSSYSVRDVASGRLGSREPNLQNIATRSKIASLIKRAFIADIGCVTLKADFSAHEINMLANVSADTAIMRAMEMARASKLALRLAKPGKELEAAIKRFAKEGDLHIINTKIIYGLDIDGDHPLRSSVKSAIFGLIYAMGPLSLGLKIIEPELKDLKKKLVELAKREQAIGKPKTKAERAEYDKIITELERISARIIEITDRDHLLKAGRDIIDKVFAAWPMAAKWLDTTRSEAQKALEVTSPTNRKRHMWAYLHSNPKTQAAMDRKGPNAVIQGLASEVACVASDLGGEFEWEVFTSNGLPLNKRLGNMVHDSQSSQIPLHLLPVGTYLTEHSMTTFPIKFYRDTFGFELQSPSGIDIEYGFNDQKEKRDKKTGKVIESGMKSWKDMRFDTMRTHVEELCEEGKASRSVRKAVLSNLQVIRDLREGELVKDQFKMDKRATHPEWWRKNIVWEV